MWPGLWLSGLLAVLAFVLSFSALRAVGVASGIDVRLGWAFPLIVDGFILLATWAAWRFRAGRLRGAWYPWAAFVVFSVVSMTGNALHARPVAVDGLLLAGWAATAFSTVPSVALLVASHMLLMIATARPAITVATDGGATGAEPATVAQSAVSGLAPASEVGIPPSRASAVPLAPDRAAGSSSHRPPGGQSVRAAREVASAPGSSGLARSVGSGPRGAGTLGAGLSVVGGHGGRALRVVGEPSPLRAVSDPVPPSPEPAPNAVAEGDPALVAWVQSQVREGRPVNGPELVAAGLAGSTSTARRWLRELRAARPEVF
nr:DUF2637 domain-containing protein [Cellulomonas sp. RIT-PI-Y]